MKNNRRRVGYVGIILLMLASTVFSQVTTRGKIQGRVIDQASGDPLVGAIIQIVEQSTLGAVTNAEGEYFIINVPVGTYSVKATLIGYRGVITENVVVSAGYNTIQNFSLTSESVEMTEVVVRAERPLVQRDQTNTTAVIKADEIRNLPLRGVEGVVSIQAGVVTGRGTDNNTFYTRGGRANETVLYVDGFEQNNLLTGEATVILSQSSIEEVQIQTGGFTAEYGRAQSGVQSVVTKEPTAIYKANLEAESDFFFGNNSRGYNIYNVSVNGPVIPGYEPLTFFASAEIRNLATARGTQGTVGNIISGNKMVNWDKGYLPNDRNDGYTLQGKVSYRFSSTARLRLNFSNSNLEKQTYFDILKYNLDHNWWDKDNNTTVSGLFSYTFDQSTYAELSAAYFDARHFSGDGVFRSDFNKYSSVGSDNPRNLYDPARGGYFFPAGWNRFQGTTSDTAGLDAYLSANNLKQYYIAADRYDPYGLYFAPGYARRFYQTYHAQYINPKFNIVSQIDGHNQIKIGAEYRYHTLAYYENNEANRGINANLINAFGYTKSAKESEKGEGGLLDGVRHPWDIAVFAQDKIEAEGLVVNAGIRFDFFNANTKTLKDERDPLGANQVPSGDPRARTADPSDFTETKTESQISPRLGIAFPITEKTVFHFNYGRFFQQSNLTDLYYGTDFIEFKAYNGSPAISVQNPNLKPEETTSYEVGITNQIGSNMRLTATAYYKDTKNKVNVRYTGTTAPGGAALYLVTNLDYGTIKGIDLSIEARRVGIVSGRLAYSLAYAEGTGSASREN
ncbi:MAG: TonB-dependent receptor, partial [Ignavibacteriales bacterium]|nr:TonB-dependent receptor [Ignavibacteriales bacterium]